MIEIIVLLLNLLIAGTVAMTIEKIKEVRKEREVCIDEDMHIDMEHMLYDDGSSYEDIYGGNIMVDRDKPYIVWEAHPNIERNKTLGGAGRLITDEAVIDELMSILTEWIK